MLYAPPPQMRVCARCSRISSDELCCDHPTIPTYQARPERSCVPSTRIDVV